MKKLEQVTKLGWIVAAALALWSQWAWAQDPAAPVRLDGGKSHAISFTVPDTDNPPLIWVRARIVLDEGEQEGAHALELALNGTRLTSQNVRILNKEVVYDRPGTVEDDPKRAGRKIISPAQPVDLFSAETGGWYIKADSDEFPFNAQGQPGDPYTSTGGGLPARVPEPNLALRTLQSRQALVSHYYEYLLALPEGLAQRQNTLTAAVKLPERLAANPVEISMGAIQPAGGVVLYQRPTVTEFTHVQQAPSLPDVVDEKSGLQMAACAGEFEPVSVTLYALRALENVTIHVEPLAREGGGETIPASAVQCYYFAQRPPHQRPGVTFPFDAEYGPDGSAPDVLVRAGEKPVAAGHPVNIAFNYRADRKDQEKIAAALARSKELEQTPGIHVSANTSQRFLVDVKIPEDQAPGTYRGAVVLQSGDKVLRRLPLTLTVHPFTLLPPRQKYWMWRQTWTPITEPSSVAAIKMIADSGIHGICRLSGIGLGLTWDKNAGDFVLDDTLARKGRKILNDAGLALNYAQDVVGGVFYAVCERRYGIRPGTAQWFGYRLMPELLDTPLDLSKFKPAARDPNDEQTARLREQMPEIRKDVVALLRRMRAKYEEVGLVPWHFAYDEPDGTHWAHPWVKFSNEVAHEAGFKTWSSHNDPLGWPSGIDMSVAAGLYWYFPNRIHAERFEGELTYRSIHAFGGFNGQLDEICVYHRALTDDEILQQHASRATKGLLAYYPLDEGRGTRAANAAGDATFDLTLTRSKYARWVDGVKGKAVEFEYPNPGDGAVDERTGKPTPTRVALTPSREVLRGEVPIPGEGWAISFWYRGRGSLMGAPFRFSVGRHGPVVDLRTKVPGQDQLLRTILPQQRGVQPDDKFWNHVTISIDPRQGVIKYYLHNPEQREWYRKNVTWDYSQYRGFNPIPCRVQAAYTTWHARDLEHMTVFVFDLNYGVANMAWPEGGERFFNRPDTRWYPELGLLALREGIDDTRYANTLYQALKAHDGEQAAWDAVAELMPGKEIQWQRIYPKLALQGMSYSDIRDRIVQAILMQSEEQ